MKMNKATIIFIVIIVLVFGGIIAFMLTGGGTSTKYDAFATCLKDKGATFYGAFWCPHCQATKKLFEESKKLPYVECSKSDGQSQTQVCIDEKVGSYPTWVFANGFTLQSSDAPHKCTNSPDESEICQKSFTPDFDIWIFSAKNKGDDNAMVGTNGAPIQKGNLWTFPAKSRLLGELPLEFFSKLTSCQLPQ